MASVLRNARTLVYGDFHLCMGLPFSGGLDASAGKDFLHTVKIVVTYQILWMLWLNRNTHPKRRAFDSGLILSEAADMKLAVARRLPPG